MTDKTKKPTIVDMTAGLSGKSQFGSSQKTVVLPAREVFECIACGVEVEKDGAAYPESGYCDMCRYAGDRDSA